MLPAHRYTKSIVLIHGAWLTPKCWERFRDHYEAMGFTVYSPSWPYYDRPVRELRQRRATEFPPTAFRDIVEHYADFIGKLSERPILMGHGVGGIVVQHLLNRGVGHSGVVIAPAPLWDLVRSIGATLREIDVHVAGLHTPPMLRLSYKTFQRRLANTLLPCHISNAFMSQVVPAPSCIFRQALAGFGRFFQVSPNRPPLLIIDATKDRCGTSLLTRAVFWMQSRASSATGYKEFQGRSHWICNEPGWEAVANYAVDWVAHVEASRASPAPPRETRGQEVLA